MKMIWPNVPYHERVGPLLKVHNGIIIPRLDVDKVGVAYILWTTRLARG